MAEVVVGDHQETPAEYDDRVAFPPVLIPGLTIRMYGVAVDKEDEPVLDEGEVSPEDDIALLVSDPILRDRHGEPGAPEHIEDGGLDSRVGRSALTTNLRLLAEGRQ